VVKLNRAKPYAEVYGGAGVLYEQAGLLFLPNGRQVGDTSTDVEPEPNIDMMLAKADSGECPVEELDETQLRALVESFGVEYQTRAQALAYLKDGGL